MNDCPNCEYHRQRAQRWREEAYKQAGHPLPDREQKPVQTIPSFTQLQQIIRNLEHCLSRDSKQEFLRVWIRDWTEHKLSQNTTPPQRTWVGLTEAQCGVLWKVDMTPFDYYQAIEAKLKEKNG